MIAALQLTNFRKHEDLSLHLTQGLTVVRGDSERGKSTLLEAIAYALFGSSVLRESLPEVVSYGKPEASLKVQLTLDVAGVAYQYSRGKSGAEITYGTERVTGQRETRLFTERLLGCTAEMFKLLVFADQGKVRGVLEDGPLAAGGLVEQLANLGLIETLIDKVQAQLPSGTTSAVKAQLDALGAGSEAPAAPATPDTAAWDQQVQALAAKRAALDAQMPAQPEIDAALAKVSASSAALVRRVDAEKALEKLEDVLAHVPKPPAMGRAEIDAARAQVALAPERRRAQKAYAVVFPTTDLEWDDSWEALLNAVQATLQAEKQARQGVADLRVKAAQITASVVREERCAFCDLDLTQVPAVGVKNTRLETELAENAAQVAALAAEEQEHTAMFEALAQVRDTHVKTLALADGEFWDVGTAIPAKPVWRGDPPAAEPVSNVDLDAAERALSAYQRQVALREQALAEFAKPLPDLVDGTEAREVLELVNDLRDKLRRTAIEQAELERQQQEQRRLHAQAQEFYQERLAAHLAGQEQRASLKKLYADMCRHNELIKKLRAARPQIASQMWGVVLGAVSHYFSQVRGTQSVVARTAAEFTVDGKSVKALSGSTKDMLGLAIRLALGKVFLPSVSFIFVDEAFAGCDVGREVRGLGALASAGFTQTVLVTHRDLADSLADTFVQL